MCFKSCGETMTSPDLLFLMIVCCKLPHSLPSLFSHFLVFPSEKGGGKTQKVIN